MASTALHPAIPHIKSGNLIGLAVTSGKRNPPVPDVPTIAEAGFPGFEDDSWVGIWVPAVTPPPVVAKLREELDRAANSPEVRERLRSIGFDASNLRGEAFGQLVKRELDKRAKVVKEKGAKVE